MSQKSKTIIKTLFSIFEISNPYRFMCFVCNALCTMEGITMQHENNDVNAAKRRFKAKRSNVET